MAIIDADGLFGGNRWRGCTNAAQLHWPRLFLASDGFGRLELNYNKIIARAYSTFNPAPSEAELQAYLQEYSQNYLLFVYGVDGQIWGQWDTPAEFLPRYKTAIDRRSPIPPELEFNEWKKRYRAETKSLQKCFVNIPESFLCGKGLVGYGEGKKTRLSNGDGPVDEMPSGGVDAEPDTWNAACAFDELWNAYPARGRVRRPLAWHCFSDKIRSAQAFRAVMDAVMGKWSRSEKWANGFVMALPSWIEQECWKEDPEPVAKPASSGPIYRKWEPPKTIGGGAEMSNGNE